MKNMFFRMIGILILAAFVVVCIQSIYVEGQSQPQGIVIYKEQTDYNGNTVTVPLEYKEALADKGIYMYYLSDPEKNIIINSYSGPYSVSMQYQSVNGVFDDGIAITVFATLLDIYDFYSDPNNIGESWKGINGKNDDIAYNADMNDEIVLNVYMHYGEEWENASCGYERDLGEAIMYVGDGKINGILEAPGNAIDIIGHEYQHAITDLAAGDGEGLEYLNESGAISESISDNSGRLSRGMNQATTVFGR